MNTAKKLVLAAVVSAAVIGVLAIEVSSARQGQSPPAPGAAVTGASQAPPVRDRRVDAVVSLAFAAPPEFGAEALIRVSKLLQRSDPKAAAKLLESAFDLAERASYEVRLTSLSPLMDSLSGILQISLSSDIDRLSLQSRIVDEFLTQGDTERARQFFDRIRVPDLAVASCKNATVYDPARFYETLGRLASAGFSKREKDRGDDVAFLSSYILRTTSIAQIPPMIGSLHLDAGGSDLAALLTPFAIVLDRLPSDDRTFTAVGAAAVGGLGLAMAQSERGGGNVDFLRTSLTKYLVRQYQGVRCADSSPEAEYRKSLEGLLKRAETRVDGSRVSITTLPQAPGQIGERMASDTLWASAASRRYFEEFGKLQDSGAQIGRGRGGGAPRSALPLDEGSRSVALHAFLDDVMRWQPVEEDDPSLALYEKAELLRMVVRVAPSDEERLRACDAFLSQLAGLDMLGGQPVRWYGYFQLFLRNVDGYSAGVREHVISELRNHRLPVIALAIQLKELEQAGAAK